MHQVLMEELDTLQRAALAKLLAGDHPVLAALRAQAGQMQLVALRYTGSGFFCDFTLPADAPLLEKLHFHIGDVYAKAPSLQTQAEFILFIEDGYIKCLEGFAYEDWDGKPEDFQLSYMAEDPTRRDPGALDHIFASVTRRDA
jgi:hypothetical protein